MEWLGTHTITTNDKWNKQRDGMGWNGMDWNTIISVVMAGHVASENGNANDPRTPLKPLLVTLDRDTDTYTHTEGQRRRESLADKTQDKVNGDTEDE